MDTEEKQLLAGSLSNVINAQRRELLQHILAQRTRHITVVLEDIYQSQNASAVIRTAECLGLQELHIIENEHEYRLNPAVVKGASKWIEINRYGEKGADNTTICLQKLRRRGYRIAAMTLRRESADLDTVSVDHKLALCFGAEMSGLSAAAYALADEYIKIPMCGFTQSFNLSVSAGISLHQLATRMRNSTVSWQLNKADRIDLYIDWLAKSTPAGRALLDRFISNHHPAK